ncbi:MAG: TatD family hydrolase [Oscillospiraceae bacterium]|nr:TatD family hydrolase [Oscillospiraceae bacterium]
MNNIFDSHAHYSDSRFDINRDKLLMSLPEKGIRYVMLASTDEDSICKNCKIAEKYEYIYTAIGIHPSDIAKTSENYIEVMENAFKSNPKVKAIGEIGLDYHYESYDREKQIEFFCRQLELADKLNLPVIIHSRDATEDTLNILKKYKPSGVMHCFSGSAETAKEVLKLGMYVSFTGVLTYKNARKAIKALTVIPNERLLLETDCPYMMPVVTSVKFKERCSDSSMIPYIAEKAGEIKNMTAQQILDITCENAMKLFRINND